MPFCPCDRDCSPGRCDERCCPEGCINYVDFDAGDWKVLQVQKCSFRCLQDLMYAIMNTNTQVKTCWPFGKNEMLLSPHWTSAEILVRIPRRMQVKSLAHKSNLDFFRKIKGVTISEPIQPKLN